MCKKCTHGGGSGGRLDAKISQISPLPLDGDPVAFVGVSKVSTKTLVSIGYGAIFFWSTLAPFIILYVVMHHLWEPLRRHCISKISDGNVSTGYSKVWRSDLCSESLQVDAETLPKSRFELDRPLALAVTT